MDARPSRSGRPRAPRATGCWPSCGAARRAARGRAGAGRAARRLALDDPGRAGRPRAQRRHPARARPRRRHLRRRAQGRARPHEPRRAARTTCAARASSPTPACSRRRPSRPTPRPRPRSGVEGARARGRARAARRRRADLARARAASRPSGSPACSTARSPARCTSCCRREYGLEPGEAEERIEVVAAGAAEARLLGRARAARRCSRSRARRGTPTAGRSSARTTCSAPTARGSSCAPARWVRPCRSCDACHIAPAGGSMREAVGQLRPRGNGEEKGADVHHPAGHPGRGAPRGDGRVGVRVADSGVDRLKPGAIGLMGVIFIAVTGAAPISAMLFNVPFATGFGTGLYTPAAFLFATIILTIFSIGYVAMARKIRATGGFYTLISHGLGRELGLATGICGALAYTLFEVSLLGGFSYFAVTNFNVVRLGDPVDPVRARRRAADQRAVLVRRRAVREGARHRADRRAHHPRDLRHRRLRRRAAARPTASSGSR